MTCVAAIAQGNNVWMCAESAVTDGFDKDNDGVSKIFIKNGVIIGSSGSLRDLNLIEHVLEVPDMPDEEGAVVKYLIPEIIKVFKEADRVMCVDGVIHTKSQLLIGVKGKLWLMGTEFDARRVKQHAIGSGGSHALGVLWMNQGQDDVKLRLIQAVQAAINTAYGCDGEINLQHA